MCFSIPGESELKMAPVAGVSKWEGALGVEMTFFFLFCFNHIVK